MGLKEEISNSLAVAAALELEDAFKSFVYRSIESSYNPSTGVARIVLESDCLGVFDAFTKTELADESILPTDVALTVIRSEHFPKDKSEPRIVPKTDDEVVRDDTGVNYKVIGFSKDPADVTYVIQLRTSADG